MRQLLFISCECLSVRLCVSVCVCAILWWFHSGHEHFRFVSLNRNRCWLDLFFLSLWLCLQVRRASEHSVSLVYLLNCTRKGNLKLAPALAKPAYLWDRESRWQTDIMPETTDQNTHRQLENFAASNYTTLSHTHSARAGSINLINSAAVDMPWKFSGCRNKCKPVPLFIESNY